MGSACVDSARRDGPPLLRLALLQASGKIYFVLVVAQYVPPGGANLMLQDSSSATRERAPRPGWF